MRQLFKNGVICTNGKWLCKSNCRDVNEAVFVFDKVLGRVNSHTKVKDRVSCLEYGRVMRPA
jgi:hypothetical protein